MADFEQIPPKIDKLVREIYETSKLGLGDNHILCPAIVLTKFKEDGDSYFTDAVPISDLMVDKVGKVVAEAIVERLIQHDDIDVVVLVTEGWMVNRPGMTLEEARQTKPSEQADRQEYVFYMVTTKTKQYQARAQILRNPVRLAELVFNVMTEDDEGIFIREKKDTPSVQ